MTRSGHRTHQIAIVGRLGTNERHSADSKTAMCHPLSSVCLVQAGGPYKGPGADSEEKHEPVSDIDTVGWIVLKALDPERPIREADVLP